MFEQHEQQSCTDDFKLSLATLTNNPHFVQLRQSRDKPLSRTQTNLILTDIHPADVLIDVSTSTRGIFRQHASGIGPYRASRRLSLYRETKTAKPGCYVLDWELG
jgi:hypothetical protein